MKNYIRTASLNELVNMPVNEQEKLEKRIKSSPVFVDDISFQPYTVVDDIRYDIIILQEKENGS